MPNPTDTTRALVEAYEAKVVQLTKAQKFPRSGYLYNAEFQHQNARAALLAHVAGVEQLATFGARVMLEHHNDGERGDVDGGWLQAAAIDTGVAKEESRVVPCSNNCPCAEWGDDGDSVPCVVIQNMPLLQALATRPTEARDDG